MDERRAAQAARYAITSRNDRDDDKIATWRTASNRIRRRQLRTSRITASPGTRDVARFEARGGLVCRAAATDTDHQRPIGHGP